MDGSATKQGAASRVHIWAGTWSTGWETSAGLSCPGRYSAESGGQERQPGGGDHQGSGSPEQAWLQDSPSSLGQGLLENIIYNKKFIIV